MGVLILDGHLAGQARQKDEGTRKLGVLVRQQSNKSIQSGGKKKTG